MILTGIARLGRDAVVRHTADQQPVANLSLAYNYGKKDADGKRAVVWVDASLWGERAGKLAPYLLKGTTLSVVLEDVFPSSYEKDGKANLVMKGRVSSIEFAGKSERAAEQPKPAAPAKPAGKFDDFEDDIPF